MLRRIIALLLCLTLVVGLSVSAAAEEQKEELLEVTLSVYSNLFGHRDVECLYQDNVLYIDQYTICEMTGARIYEEDSYSVTFSLHNSLRHIKVTTEGRLNEELTMGRAYSVNADIPVLARGGKIWVSAAPLLRYMGAVVGFGEDEYSPTHLMVSMPYTIYDLIAEYGDTDGYWFSWSEAEGKYVDPEDTVYLAALDTIMFGYDSNLLAYASASHGDKVHKDIYSDLLSEILRTEGAELNDSGYNEVDLFEDASDTWSFSASWIGEVLGWIEDSRFAGKLNSSMSGALNASGVLVSAGGDYLESLSAAMQFANMSSTQKDLLNKTLNAVSEFSPYYQELPLLFEASDEVSALIGNKYAAEEKAAWDGIYSLMVNSATTAMNSINPFALAWDSLTTIAKLDPLLDDLLNDEKSITFAAEAQNIALIARSLASEDWKDLYTHNLYMLTDDTSVHELLKADIILELKATLLIRQLLVDTGWLTEASENGMEYQIQWTAELLNKAQNAKCVTIKNPENRDEDIRWIANLAGNYSLGWAQKVGGNTYYWKFTEDDYGTGAYWGNFGQAEDTAVEMVVCSADGYEKELFTTEVATDFVVIGGKIYYSAHGELVIYDQKTGTTDYTGNWGTLQGVNKSGSHVVCAYDENLYSYRIADGSWTLVAVGAEYVTIHRNRIYYSVSPEYSIAIQGQVSLYSMAMDGSDDILLCTTEPDLYDNIAVSEAMVAQIRFSDDYVFFSYGSIGGTGLMYQSGNIIRVGYDGSDPTVIATNVGAQFSVTDNSVVNSDTNEIYYAMFDALIDYQETKEGLFYLDPISGVPVKLMDISEYQNTSMDISAVVNVTVQKGKAYVLVHYGTRDPSGDLGWREYYARSYSVFYLKDLESGKLTELYRF